MEQKLKAKQKKTEAEVQEHNQPEPNIDDAEIDAMLSEIDEVLEENAEAFVRGYVQKGGE